MQCAESLRLQAYFDGEVDALSAAGIEAHLDHCAECRALLKDLQELRAALRSEIAHEAAPAGLRSRLSAALDAERPAAVMAMRPAPRRRRAFWAGALSGVGGSALAASLAFFVMMPAPANLLVDDLVNAHIRSLMPAHLIDVVSTDRHTVKPWFAGHADVSPAVADFDAQGYRLVGGRADYLDGQRAAAVVYQHGAHVINVFSWASAAAPVRKDATRNGYHLAFWKVGNLQYCAVSDAGWEEVSTLRALLEKLADADSRE